jgi:hypothetical protein
VTFVFGKSGFRVEFTVAALGLGGQRFTGGRIRAAYQIEKTAGGMQAVRQGPIRFLPPSRSARNGKTIDMPSAPLRLLQEAVFGQILRQRLARADLRLPAPFARVKALTPTNAESDNGWLKLDWKLASKAKKPSPKRKS